MTSDASIGWGVLGCGRMTDRRMAPAFRHCPSARLVAFQSRDAAKAEAFRAKHGADRACADIETFLADDDIRAIYVATPPALHAEHVMRCLDAGKDVLVDKPIALSADDAMRLVEAAAARRLTLGVLHQQRFHPAIRRLMKLVSDGALGTLHTIRIQIAMWLRLEGNWRYDPAIGGGGAAMDLAPHALDILLKLLGAPASVAATLANQCLDADVEDFCAATIEFDSGAVGLLDVSYSGHAYGGRVEAFGDEGTFVSDGCMQQAESYTTHLRRRDDPGQLESHPYDGMCFRDAIEDFCQALRANCAPAVTGLHAASALRVVDAIYASAQIGRVITIPETEPPQPA
ncbi:MAG TPA: Gfo/Idh/MocA family oxidoreductase [Phycisphaerae bacterium]|nr:Gfo/Idh/MocA family oxidoreductase [Phycisphaerae bacterium]HRW53435.1 Gfo/Idh/MocA family oxidoreductase [Phycisphaerae bacterium]